MQKLRKTKLSAYIRNFDAKPIFCLDVLTLFMQEVHDYLQQHRIHHLQQQNHHQLQHFHGLPAILF